MHVRHPMTSLAVVGLVLVVAPPAFGAAPSNTKRCPLGAVRAAGPGRVLGLYVQRAALQRRAAARARLPALSRQCDGRAGAATTASTAAASSRCSSGAAARPTASYRRTRQGLPLHRAAAVPDQRPLRRERRAASRGRRRIDHSYTLFTGRSRRRRHRARAARGLGQPALHARSRSRATSCCTPAGIGDPIRESLAPDHARRRRPHAPAGVLREAAAAPGRDGLRGAEEHRR